MKIAVTLDFLNNRNTNILSYTICRNSIFFFFKPSLLMRHNTENRSLSYFIKCYLMYRVNILFLWTQNYIALMVGIIELT